MTEQEIIKAWKTNEKGFMFLPKEMQEWAKKHTEKMRRYNHNDMSWTTTPDIFCDTNVYRLSPDYPETTPLPELEKGFYFIIDRKRETWMYGYYDLEKNDFDDIYTFVKANDNGTFNIDPAKWWIHKIQTNCVNMWKDVSGDVK